MHYFIDGYNFLFRLGELKKDLQTGRDEIISFIQQEFAELKLKGFLFFDGSHPRGEQSGTSYKTPLVIVYSSKGETADRIMLERIEGSRTKSQITLVTDDRSLSLQARELGAHTLTLKAFLAKLRACRDKELKKEQEQKAPPKESKRELDRLLAEFERRLMDL